jgi:hypothetical protein
LISEASDATLAGRANFQQMNVSEAASQPVAVV